MGEAVADAWDQSAQKVTFSRGGAEAHGVSKSGGRSRRGADGWGKSRSIGGRRTVGTLAEARAGTEQKHYQWVLAWN